MSKREVASLVAGAVARLDVAVGDKVREGQSLLIIESMKMEIPLEAPVKGAVLMLHTEAGDSVEEGQVLVTLDI
jgi:acetyl-CoA carboxylase biotin carboxyl carrier protein